MTYQTTAPPAWPATQAPAPVPAPPMMHSAGYATYNPQFVSGWGRLGANLLDGVLITVTLGIGWVIWAAMIAGEGQTPAKRICGHQVVDSGSYAPVGMGRMFWMRGLIAGFVAGFAIPFTLGVLLFMPFWDGRNQNLWDKVSSTCVVRATR